MVLGKGSAPRIWSWFSFYVIFEAKEKIGGEGSGEKEKVYRVHNPRHVRLCFQGEETPHEESKHLPFPQSLHFSQMKKRSEFVNSIFKLIKYNCIFN